MLRKGVIVDNKRRYAIIFVVILVFALCGDIFALRFIKAKTNPHDVVFHTGKTKDYDSYQIDYFKQIEVEELVSKINNKESFYLILTRESCYTCGEYLPVVKEFFDKYSINDIFYMNRGKYNKENEVFKSIIEKYPNMMYTPYLMGFKNGELKGELIGKHTLEELDQWMKLLEGE